VSGNPKSELRLKPTRNHQPPTATTHSTPGLPQPGHIPQHACAPEATPPQGWVDQTPATSIKETPVSGGGGEVAVFHINPCPPSKVDNFFSGHFLKLVIFKASERKRSQVNLTYTNVSRQKT